MVVSMTGGSMSLKVKVLKSGHIESTLESLTLGVGTIISAKRTNHN